MENDWSLDASAPTFSLFKKSTPAEEAEKNTFVDIIVYNRWSKAERRLYQKLKTLRIVKQIEEEHIHNMDDITSALEGLNFMKKNTVEPPSPEVEDLIGRLEQIKIAKTQEGNRSR